MTKTINQKLLAFQQKVNSIKKDGKNPHFKSTYATLTQILSEVKPILSDVGLIVTQPIIGGSVHTIILDSESGEKIEGNIDLPTNQNPQQIGSAITYYRRYLLAGMLALEIEDDDANLATHSASQPHNDTKQSAEPTSDNLTWLNKFTSKDKSTITIEYTKVVEALKSGNYTLADIRKKYKVSKEIEGFLSEDSK